MTTVIDPELTDLQLQVYAFLVESIGEEGEPMRQAVMANKLSCALNTVRTALRILDRKGHITFIRHRPQLTTLTDPNRKLFNRQPVAAMPWDRP